MGQYTCDNYYTIWLVYFTFDFESPICFYGVSHIYWTLALYLLTHLQWETLVFHLSKLPSNWGAFINTAYNVSLILWFQDTCQMWCHGASDTVTQDHATGHLSLVLPLSRYDNMYLQNPLCWSIELSRYDMKKQAQEAGILEKGSGIGVGRVNRGCNMDRWPLCVSSMLFPSNKSQNSMYMHWGCALGPNSNDRLKLSWNIIVWY
jgi:hypothetical protein